MTVGQRTTKLSSFSYLDHSVVIREIITLLLPHVYSYVGTTDSETDHSKCPSGSVVFQAQQKGLLCESNI